MRVTTQMRAIIGILNGRGWVSVPSLALSLGVSRQNFSYAMKRLIDDGQIERFHKDRPVQLRLIEPKTEEAKLARQRLLLPDPPLRTKTKTWHGRRNVVKTEIVKPETEKTALVSPKVNRVAPTKTPVTPKVGKTQAVQTKEGTKPLAEKKVAAVTRTGVAGARTTRTRNAATR
jgi:hypothetical protein